MIYDNIYIPIYTYITYLLYNYIYIEIWAWGVPSMVDPKSRWLFQY